MKVPTDHRRRRGGPRGRTNGNERGSAIQRRARKQWLIATYPAREKWRFFDYGYLAFKVISKYLEGRTRCYACGELLDADTMTVDRIMSGVQGGKYTRSNIRPACAHCNSATAEAAKK